MYECALLSLASDERSRQACESVPMNQDCNGKLANLTQ